MKAAFSKGEFFNTDPGQVSLRTQGPFLRSERGYRIPPA
jgi:hypothetical protein